jgi:hypothetical protein
MPDYTHCRDCACAALDQRLIRFFKKRQGKTGKKAGRAGA